MGSGKDTVGALLFMLGYRPVAFAAAVRAEVLAAKSDGKELPQKAPWLVRLAWSLMRPSDVWRKPTNWYTRVVLQWWGTEYRRAQDPDYWVKLATGNNLDHRHKYAFTDVRFENEISAIIQMGGTVIGVNGRSCKKWYNFFLHNHSSEREVFGFHYSLDNSNSLLTTASHLMQILRQCETHKTTNYRVIFTDTKSCIASKSDAPLSGGTALDDVDTFVDAILKEREGNASEEVHESGGHPEEGTAVATRL